MTEFNRLTGMQKILVAIAALLLIGAAGGFLYTQKGSTSSNDDQSGVVCTQEARLCPDGSYVGRTGPSCEFSACPPATTSSGNVTLETSLHKSVAGGGVAINPIELVSDSRCPSDVQCIQAGTVVIKAEVVSANGDVAMTFELNKPVTTEAQTITMIQVAPLKVSKSEILPTDYRFTFVVSPR